MKLVYIATLLAALGIGFGAGASYMVATRRYDDAMIDRCRRIVEIVDSMEEQDRSRRDAVLRNTQEARVEWEIIHAISQVSKTCEMQ